MGPWSTSTATCSASGVRTACHAAVTLRLRRLGRLRGLLRLLGLLVRDSGVAVDARRLAVEEFLVLAARVLRLLLAVPRLRVVAGAAVLRVVRAHLVPHLVGEAPALVVELLAGGDRAAHLAPGVADPGLRLVEELGRIVVRDVAVVAHRANAGAVV